jgi:hypothetical protein
MALARFVPFAGFGEFPLELPDAAFSLFDFPNKFACITGCTTFGADITITFEAVYILLALVAAVRTRNLDGFFIEHDGRVRMRVSCVALFAQHRFDSPGGSMIAEPQLRAFLESFPAFGGTLPAHGAIHFLLNSQDTSLWR